MKNDSEQVKMNLNEIINLEHLSKLYLTRKNRDKYSEQKIQKLQKNKTTPKMKNKNRNNMENKMRKIMQE